MKQDLIVILDLGSIQNTVLARQIRDFGVYSEIHPHDITADELKKLPNVKGIILNGGENRVVDGQAVEIREELYETGYPMISIDYPSSKCETKLTELPDRETLKKFLFQECGAEGASGPFRRSGFLCGGGYADPGHRAAAGMCACKSRPDAQK